MKDTERTWSVITRRDTSVLSFRCAKRSVLPDSTRLAQKRARESTVKTPQHKVTQNNLLKYIKNPVYVNLLVGIVNHCLLFPSGTKIFGKILIQKRRLNFMTLCYGILTIGTSSSFSRGSCFTGQNEVFCTTE